VSIPGVYGGFPDKSALGGAFAKGLTLKMGQTNVHRYLPRLFAKAIIDPSFVITHTIALNDAADGYKTLHEKKGQFIKVVMKPHAD
jgi:threonine dehydrogenase-like Zn-dependent dehydrogenase